MMVKAAGMDLTMPDTPTNITPADGFIDQSISPTLVASSFSSDTIVTTAGGDNEPEWRVGLSVSRDGVNYGPEIYRTMGTAGNYETRLYWGGPGGLGRYESYMGIRLRANAPIEFSVDGLWIFV